MTRIKKYCLNCDLKLPCTIANLQSNNKEFCLRKDMLKTNKDAAEFEKRYFKKNGDSDD